VDTNGERQEFGMEKLQTGIERVELCTNAMCVVKRSLTSELAKRADQLSKVQTLLVCPPNNRKKKLFMDNYVIKQAGIISRKIRNLSNYNNSQNLVPNVFFAKTILSEVEFLIKKVPEIYEVNSVEELYILELKRYLELISAFLKRKIVGKRQNWVEIKELYYIQDEDLLQIENWLRSNKELIFETSNRLLNSDKFANVETVQWIPNSYKIKEKIEREMLRLVEILVRFTKDTFAKNDDRIAQEFDNYIFDFNYDIRSSVFRENSKAVLFNMNNIVNFQEGKPIIDFGLFVEHFGHEVWGHCMNQIMTRISDLPEFLKIPQTAASKTIEELVSIYFEKKIFVVLEEKQDYYEEFRTNISFADFIKEYKTIKLMLDYSKKLRDFVMYQVITFNQISETDLLRRVAKYSLSEEYAKYLVNTNIREYNSGKGFFDDLYFLRYHSLFLDKLISNIDKSKINKAERAFLTGYWSPDGLKEWINLNINK